MPSQDIFLHRSWFFWTILRTFHSSQLSPGARALQVDRRSRRSHILSWDRTVSHLLSLSFKFSIYFHVSYLWVQVFVYTHMLHPFFGSHSSIPLPWYQQIVKALDFSFNLQKNTDESILLNIKKVKLENKFFLMKQYIKSYFYKLLS